MFDASPVDVETAALPDQHVRRLAFSGIRYRHQHTRIRKTPQVPLFGRSSPQLAAVIPIFATLKSTEPPNSTGPCDEQRCTAPSSTPAAVVKLQLLIWCVLVDERFDDALNPGRVSSNPIAFTQWTRDRVVLVRVVAHPDRRPYRVENARKLRFKPRNVAHPTDRSRMKLYNDVVDRSDLALKLTDSLACTRIRRCGLRQSRQARHTPALEPLVGRYGHYACSAV